MFVPVSCTSCGKPFQVPESVLGQPVPCPWCRAAVAALPVAAVPSAPIAPPGEVLSLDDADQPAAPPPPPPATAPPRRPVRVSPASVAALVVACVLIAGGTVAALRYGAGHIPEASWTPFAAPDGSFTVDLPGAPEEEDVDAYPGGSVRPGKRFTVRGWYSKAAVWVACADLDPALAPKLKLDRDRVLSAGALQAAREHERARLGGTVTSEVPVRLNAAWGVELQLDTPRGAAAVWLLLVGEGPRPRVYTLGIEGKGVTGKGTAARRLFGSFKLAE